MASSSPYQPDLDAKLNFESECFNALQVLTVEEKLIKLPVEKAKLFQNLVEYENKSFPKKSNILLKSEKKEETKEEVKKPREMPYSGGYELPFVSKPRKELKNVLTKMYDNDGPISLLSKCLNKRIRVILRRRKLTIDNCDTFATLFGHLVAFDRHFNIILKDVQEFVKILNQDNLKSKNAFPRERSLKFIFIRGANVVLISMLN